MNDSELERYSRHILMPQIDLDGQLAIGAAHVVVVGLGGLGSPVALYLAASGVGKLTLIDPDRVELSNLQRQVLHSEKSLGQSKVRSAADRLHQMNTKLHIVEMPVAANSVTLAELPDDVTVVVDCTDNAAVRYDLNRWCLQRKVPWVSGAAAGLSGQLMVFNPGNPESPCYACLYPQQPEVSENCSETGVLSPLLGIIGSLQATEALRLITSFGKPQAGNMQIWDVAEGRFQTIGLPCLADCHECYQTADTGR